MRKFAQKAYTLILRIEGGYALVTCLAFFAGLPAAIANEYHMLVPGIISLITFTLAVLYLIPRVTPAWLAAPRGWKAGLAVLATHGLMPLMMMMTTFSAVLAYEIPEPTSQTVAVSLAVIHFLMLGALWWLAVILLVFPTEPTPPARPVRRLDDPDLTAA